MRKIIAGIDFERCDDGQVIMRVTVPPDLTPDHEVVTLHLFNQKDCEELSSLLTSRSPARYTASDMTNTVHEVIKMEQV